MTDAEAMTLDTGARITMTLRDGTVRPGFFLGCFDTMDGQIRVVVEHPYKMLHIYAAAQIEFVTEEDGEK